MTQIFKNNKANKAATADVSLLITTYNNFKYLKFVLESTLEQSFRNFEIVICDDGSNDQNVQEIKKYIENFELPVIHVWHEDRGFRRAEALNRGIAAAKGQYIIMVDQDCILHPDFILDHYNNRQEKTLLAARRSEFTPYVTRLIMSEKIKVSKIEKNLWWILPMISLKRHGHPLRSIRMTNPFLLKHFNKKERSVVGSNFSAFKNDILDVNGFNNDFIGAGFEESDLEKRMHFNGCKTKPLFQQGLQYHLWHPFIERVSTNTALFNETLKNQKTKISNGIQKLR